MDTERGLLTALVREGEGFSDVIDANVTADDILDESVRKAFVFIREFWLEHSKVPDRKTVELDFHGVFLTDKQAPEPLSFYIDEMVADKGYRTLYDGIEEAVELIDSDDRLGREDNDRVANILAARLEEYHSHSGRLNSVDIVTRSTSWWTRYEAEMRSNRRIKGVPFGLPAIDLSTQGMRPQQLWTIIGLPKSGKAQPLTTPVLTPTGWVPMGEIQPGDEVVGSDGRPTTVEAIHPQGVVPTYRVLFDDGASTEACGNHLWQTLPHNKNPRVLNTEQVKEMIEDGTDHRQLYVPVVEPVELAENRSLPLPPRLLGLLLGDGSFRGTCPAFVSGDDELVAEVMALSPSSTASSRRDNHVVVRMNQTGERNPAMDALSDMGLWGKKSLQKFIPPSYLRSSVEQRMDLLRGLMDTDGGMNGKSSCFYTSSARLKDDVVDLVRSLGGVATVRRKETTRADAYNVSIRLPETLGSPFGLVRKTERWESSSENKRPPTRRIIAVERVEDQPSQCITVSAADSLYVTEDYIVTHNSLVALRAAHVANNWGCRALFVSFEMSVEEQEERYHALNSNVSLTRMQQGRLTADERDRVKRSFKYRERNMGGLVIAEDPYAMTTVTAVASQVQQHNPDVVYIDGVYMMDDEKGEPPMSPQALTNITRGLKRMAQRLNIPVCITSQALEWKTTKKRGVTASSAGYSSSFQQDSDVFMTINTHPEDVAVKVYETPLVRTGSPVKQAYRWDFNRTGYLEEVELTDMDDEDFSEFDGSKL